MLGSELLQDVQHHCGGSKAPEEFRGKDEGKLHVAELVGLSTRTIGVMVMVHGDDDGLVMPPRVSQVQVIIVPCGIGVKNTPAEKEAIMDACDKTAKDLQAAGIRAKADLRDNYSPGFNSTIGRCAVFHPTRDWS